MVGVDEHAYSDYALVWLLNNMVDDGDQVICVRVLESPPKTSEKSYRDEAKRLLQAIQAKNELNKAISIILEYAVGKLHDTFQQLVSWLFFQGTWMCHKLTQHSSISTSHRCLSLGRRDGRLEVSRGS